MLQALDFGVKALGHGIGDGVSKIGQQILKVNFYMGRPKEPSAADRIILHHFGTFLHGRTAISIRNVRILSK